MAPPSLEELARKAAGGDRGALRAIYERTADELFRQVLAPLLPTRAACEDALKETFLSALEHPEALAQGEVMPWLATVARRKALDRLRRLSTEGRSQPALAAEAAQAQQAQPDPEDLAALAQARSQARERIDAVLAQMNERYAAALRLRLLEDRSREECARALEVKVPTFDVLLFRACKQFRALYVERYGAKVEV
jgi:RNA polymerase sigma-70 factor (ECF subfamily)